MPELILDIKANVRHTSRLVPNFSVLANVSMPFWNKRAQGFVERPEKIQANQPEFEHTEDKGYTYHFRQHNSFRDQNRYDVMIKAVMKRQAGTKFAYYTTTFDVSSDPLHKEDNNRTIDRYFEIPALVGFNPQNELYKRFGLQYTAKQEIYLHMPLFLERNYASLRREGIVPKCDPKEHNPIWWQRGYEEFRYFGYTADQIFPKAGDKLKPLYDNKLYNVSSVTDEIPEYEYKWRKYFWKLYLEVALDNGMQVSESVKNDPEQRHFIDNLLGLNNLPSGATGEQQATSITPGYAFDVSDIVDEMKKDVLFHPPEVKKCVKNVTQDPDWYACSNKFGMW